MINYSRDTQRLWRRAQIQSHLLVQAFLMVHLQPIEPAKFSM